MSDSAFIGMGIVGAVVIWGISFWGVRRERAALRREDESAEVRPAGFAVRLGARMIDLLPVNLVFPAALLGVAVFQATGLLANWAWWAATAASVPVAFLAYFTTLTARRGQTWGKMLAGVVVERASGGRLGFARALVRSLADLVFLSLTYVLIGYLDALVLALTRRKRSLHDMIAGSVARRTGLAPSPILPWVAALCWGAPFVLVFGLLRPYVAQAFYMPSVTMTPTLALSDHFLVNKMAYRLGPVRRGDIVTFVPPPAALPQPAGTVQHVKRVIGVAGDTVKIRRGVGVFVNGKLLKEPYAAELPNYDYPSGPDESYLVPSGHCFVLGDNRNVSADSHIWGALPVANVRGKVAMRYWPLRRAGDVR